MISPVSLPAVLHRTDITRVHYSPGQLPPRHVSDGMALMARAIAYLPVHVVRIERGVPTRALRKLTFAELGHHRLLQNVTAYAWAFEHHEDGQAPATYMLVVADSEVRSPNPGEQIEFWTSAGLVRNGRAIPQRRPPTAKATPAEPTPQPKTPRRTKPPTRPDGRTGKKGAKNKGRKRR